MERERERGREGREGERGRNVEGPGKWSAPGPALALGGPDQQGGTAFVRDTCGSVFLCFCRSVRLYGSVFDENKKLSYR